MRLAPNVIRLDHEYSIERISCENNLALVKLFVTGADVAPKLATSHIIAGGAAWGCSSTDKGVAGFTRTINAIQLVSASFVCCGLIGLVLFSPTTAWSSRWRPGRLLPWTASRTPTSHSRSPRRQRRRPGSNQLADFAWLTGSLW